MIKKAADELTEFAGIRHVDENRLATRSAELSTDALQAWLVPRLAASLDCRPEEIDLRLPFTALGLDSLQAFKLTGELANWLQQELPATLLWDFDTVEELVRHLGSRPSA